MLTNKINEITVWLDQLEDEGQDVSLIRLLCSYNYLVSIVVHGDKYLTTVELDGFNVQNTYWHQGSAGMVREGFGCGWQMDNGDYVYGWSL